MANVAAYSGLRWGEIAALTIDQVDTAARVISVDRKVAEVAGHLHIDIAALSIFLASDSAKSISGQAIPSTATPKPPSNTLRKAEAPDPPRQPPPGHG